MRYERMRRLGRGGMGVVDLARADDGRLVALKTLTLHGSAAEIARARQRIRREAEVLARLAHPNVVELLDVLEEGDDVTLVMPYLSGGTLSDRVAAHGPAPAEEVLRLTERLGGALAAAHRAGIVHRDIKPANVLFDDDGEPHLADFGVASSRDDTAGLTAIGTVVGTPAFMAPEQARGEPADRAADVFSLGATLRYAVTGEGPYGTGSADLLVTRAAAGKVQPLPRSLPPELRRRLEAMLDPRPDRRPSAAALAGGPDGTEVRAAVSPHPARVARRLAPAWVLGGVAAVGLLAAVAVAGRETGSGPATPTTASTTTTAACVDRPYRPCGGPVAPNTDGEACLPGFDDYDEDPANGCEAEPDGLEDGTVLVDRIEGTIVPRDDVDVIAVPVRDSAQLLCDGTLRLTLTAPAGMALRLEVLDGDDLLDETTSADGVPGEVALREPSCLRDDSTTLTARITPIGSDRSAEPYVLERRGSY